MVPTKTRKEFFNEIWQILEVAYSIHPIRGHFRIGYDNSVIIIKYCDLSGKTYKETSHVYSKVIPIEYNRDVRLLKSIFLK